MKTIFEAIAADPNVNDAFKDGMKAAEAKHTPGPWLIEPSTNGMSIVHGGAPGDSFADGTRFAIQLKEANARLVMMAPDLCESLFDTLRMLEAAHRQLGMYTKDNPRIVKARAVIAKATGAQK